MADRIYFDNAATAPIDSRVAQAMEPCHHGVFGNPSSLHEDGRKAREAVERARGQVAELLNCKPGEIIFTASGTESDNLALTGVAEACGVSDIHIITSVIEHPAILETCHYLARRRVAVTKLPVGADGIVGSRRTATRIAAGDKTGIHHGGKQCCWHHSVVARTRAHRARTWGAVSYRRCSSGRKDPVEHAETAR